MSLQKTFIPIFILISLCFASCSGDDDSRGEAKVIVTVVSDTGERLSDEIVQLFDEKTHEKFKKDNRTLPTAHALTDSNGVTTFVFSYDEWFKSKKERFFTFVVQFN